MSHAAAPDDCRKTGRVDAVLVQVSEHELFAEVVLVGYAREAVQVGRLVADGFLQCLPLVFEDGNLGAGGAGVDDKDFVHGGCF